MFYGVILDTGADRIAHVLDMMKDNKRHANWHHTLADFTGWMKVMISVDGDPPAIASGWININGRQTLPQANAVVTNYGLRFTWEPLEIVGAGSVTITMIVSEKRIWLDRYIDRADLSYL